MARRNRRESGSLLIITLWLVTILAAFAVAIARYLSVEVRVTTYRLARAQAAAMAHSGVFVAMRRLAQDGTHGDEAYDWLGDADWAFVQGDGPDPAPTWELRSAAASIESTGQLVRGARAWVTITDEERCVNLNGAPGNAPVTGALAALFGAASDELVAKIVDYVDADTAASTMPSGAAGLEIDRSMDPPYMAKNAPVAVFEELQSIPGMERVPPETMASVRGLTSVHYGPGAALNINTAPGDVLSALGVSAATVEAVQRFRDGPDGAELHEQDGQFDQPAAAIVQTLKGAGWNVGNAQQQAADEALLSGMGVASQTFTVVSTGEMPLSPRRGVGSLVSARVEAVVRRKGCGDSAPEPCIIAWREW